MADQVWARDVVLTVLRRRDRAGEDPATLEELREEAGLGPSDAEVVVGILVDEEKIRLVTDDDGAERYELNAVEGDEQVTAPEAAAPPPDAGAITPELVNFSRRFLAQQGLSASAIANLSDAELVAEANSRFPSSGGAPAPAAEEPAAPAAATPASSPVAGAPLEHRLSPAMIDAMDAEGLGKFIKAGIDEAKGKGSPFVFVVSDA